MNPSEVRNLIQTTFINAGVFSTDYIALDNQGFTPPADDTPWTRLAIRFNDGRQNTLGKKTNRKFKKQGILFIQVFTISEGATDVNDALAQSSLEVFEGEKLNGIHFNNGRIRTVGIDEKWWQQNAVLDFTYYEIK